ncbi:hypothetical protein SAMN06264364_11693 [Quadrisphaera granulorum]|uniref:Uncharacterized protein n=1 Tax=Quadrisphaera granulorum TaxID=317664 RepID=A0A316AS73_9ACTN|nr:hypothetical protein BXY45_11693 [Quadrisphaera granulorum]SZE97339.1 hypothetical protein SAMN06264364_11693 [Quadrisphaera granulorum]
MVVLGAVGLGVFVATGALLLVVMALSVTSARAGRQTAMPLVGARNAQFGDAIAASRSAQAAQPVDVQVPLRLVRPSAAPADEAPADEAVRPQPGRAA